MVLPWRMEGGPESEVEGKDHILDRNPSISLIGES